MPFTISYQAEPHATRRALILKKYPQVKKLMSIDPNFKWQVVALVSAQLISFYLLQNVRSFWFLFALAYFVGGVANHAIMLAIHEISHGMAFGVSRPVANKLFSIFANLPLGVPMSISFKKYHLDHHRYQGDELLDTDIPTDMEAALFTTPPMKLLWCILQPFFYTLRPLFVSPKPIGYYELINIIVQLAFDFMVVRFLGWHILAYAIGGSVLAMGLHPVAGHFISEHHLIYGGKKASKKMERDSNNNSKQGDLNDGAEGCRTLDERDGSFLIPETCSYYGPLNYLTFNVGYHVEHHDFPSIPGSRLPELSKIAPEFYLNLNYHTSWTNVLWQYITDPSIGPWKRVRRPHQGLQSKQLSDD